MPRSAVTEGRAAAVREPPGAGPAPAPLRSLTFVVTAGRSGSTAVSAILRSHPDVLSLSEFFLCLRTIAAARRRRDLRGGILEGPFSTPSGL
jgi:hypothetical protein